MLKFIPLVLLIGMAATMIVAAPKPPVKEGLVSHEAAAKSYVIRSLPHQKKTEWWLTAELKVRYAVAGVPGETYAVELWLGLPDELVERSRRPGHFDTQEVRIPGEGNKFVEVRGIFDRRNFDRPPDEGPKGGSPPPWYELKPGTFSLIGPSHIGKAWNCRLVVKNRGKTVSDTGYFRVVLPTDIDL